MKKGDVRWVIYRLLRKETGCNLYTSTGIVVVVKYTIPVAGHVTELEESRNAYKIFVGYHIKMTRKIEMLKMGRGWNWLISASMWAVMNLRIQRLKSYLQLYLSEIANPNHYEVSLLDGKLSLIIVFARDRQQPRQFHSMPSNCVPARSILIIFSHPRQWFTNSVFLQIFVPKFCMHFSSHKFMLHVSPMHHVR